jgi:molybdate transport system substrate-binding protein
MQNASFRPTLSESINLTKADVSSDVMDPALLPVRQDAGTSEDGGEAMWKRTMLAFAAAIPLVLAAQVQAAELKIFVGGAMTETLKKIGADFERTSGNTLDFVSDTTGSLQNRLRAGEKADVVVITAAGMDALAKEGRIVPDSRTDLVRALIGVGIRQGAVSPDISSADSFKNALIAARSVSYVSPAAGGTSGTYFEGLLARMGIAEAMKPKIVYRTQGSEVADAVAKGDAEIGITFISEMAPNKGVKVAGPLPDAIQLPTDYVAALPQGGGNTDAARAFIQAMKGPVGDAVFKEAGLTVLGGH